MASTDVVLDFALFKIFADGHVEKLYEAEKVPPSNDPNTGIQAKDAIISNEVSARLFLPKLTSIDHKFPVIVYIHGGGFALDSAFCPTYDAYVSALASNARAICISVDYRLVPENPITACYEDCWTAFKWVTDHVGGNGIDPWLNEHADFEKLFIAGDSAGGNLAYNLTVQAGKSKLPNGVKLIGTVLVDSYFSGCTDEVDRMWMYYCPNNTGLNDPRIKPYQSDLKQFPPEKVLVFVSEKDEYNLRDIGYAFVDQLKGSGWSGKVDIFESIGEIHCFHLYGDIFRPAAKEVMDRFVSFINDK
uniref:Carboxylesterase n=1 Tax=Sedum lineare TaxID=114260 RepID=A0A482LR72_SEDLI|nr:carboxylesterase [Sedum lineare]